MSRTLDARLDNWSACWRIRVRSTLTVKGVWSTRRGYGHAYHWDYALGAYDRNGVALAVAPSTRESLDVADAQAIELAVSALDTYHHCVLKGHYVRFWPPERTMRVARQFGGINGARKRATAADYDAALGMAKVLLQAVVDRPAVIRRARAAKAVALALDLPELGQ